MPCLHLDLLGGMSVAVDGRPLPALNGTRTGLLLVRLLLEHGDQLARAELAATFWPDLPPAAARSNLRQHLFQLNRQLGADNGGFIHSTPESVRFNHDADVVSDAQALLQHPDEADHIAAALAQYRGPFLAGIDSRIDSGELHQWVLDRREYYWQQAVARLDRLTHALRAAGRVGEALPHVERFLQLDPVDEVLHRMKLAVLIDEGLPDAAQRHYDQCRETLARELGVEPDPATSALRDTAAEALTCLPARTNHHAALPQEERLVTAVCCQFEVATDIELESATRTVQHQAEAAAERLRAHRGHVIPVHGGALLAYFGYPAADEEASVNAVRAAVSATAETGAGVISRALVHGDRIVTGKDPEMPDPAGRLSNQVLARIREVPGGGVAVTDSVRATAEGFFELARIDAHARRAGDHQLPLWRVDRDPGIHDRIDTERSQPTSEVLGRDQEQRTLQQYWRQSRQGRARMVLVRGEPGIGKSHLVRGFARTVRAREGDRVLLLRGLREYRHAMAEPIRHALRNAFDLPRGGDVSHEQARSVIAGRTGLPEAVVRTLAHLASASGAVAGDTQHESVHRRETVIEALLALANDTDDGNGTLLVCDDVQWMDSVTLDFLRRIVQRLPTAPILTVLAARPQFELPWSDVDVAELALGPLPADTSQQIAMRVDRRRRLTAREYADLAARAEGVPLFVEELTRDRLEHGADAGPDAGGTLAEFLAARLERLGPVRELAQCAAVIGRSFSRECLARITGSPTATLDDGLARLQRQGLIHRLDDAPEERYRFSHALFQRAAYDCQLRSARADLHGAMAAALQDHEREGRSVPPARVAHHLLASGQATQAGHYYLRAGDAALAVAMHHEASDHFARARAAAETSADGNALTIEALVGEGSARVALEGYGAASVYSLFTEAARLAAPDTPTAHRFRIIWGLWLGASSWVGFAEAHRLAAELERIAIDTGDRQHQVAACYAQSNTHYWTGDFTAALDYARRAAAAYRAEDHVALTTTFGEDCGYSAQAYIGWALWQLGHARQAREEMRALCATVDACGHPATRAYVHTFAAVLAQFMDDPEWAREAAATTRAIAAEMHYPLWNTAACAIDAWARAHTGDASALAEIRATVDAMRQSMDGVVTMFLYLLMRAAHDLDQHRDVEPLATEALAQSARTGEQHLRPEILRLRGLARLANGAKGGVADAGRQDLDAAIHEAQAQGAVLIELRARGAQLRHAESAASHSRLAAALRAAVQRCEPEECPVVQAARAQIHGGQLSGAS